MSIPVNGEKPIPVQFANSLGTLSTTSNSLFQQTIGAISTQVTANSAAAEKIDQEAEDQSASASVAALAATKANPPASTSSQSRALNNIGKYI